MKKALYSADFKKIDNYTIEKLGVPSLTLMERAADGVYNEILSDLEDPVNVSIIIVCGKGNNGADGLALARMLARNKLNVCAVVTGVAGNLATVSSNLDTGTEEFRFQLNEALKVNCPLYSYEEGIIEKIFLKNADMDTIIVDSLVGIGITSSLRGVVKDAATEINTIRESNDRVYVYSVDIPSGAGYENGVIADKVVTFGDIKLEMLLYPGALNLRKSFGNKNKSVFSNVNITDNLVVKKIGFAEAAYKDLQIFNVLEDADIKRLPKRLESGNKGTFGKVFLACGSRGMCGAAILSAKAALRTGAGMVKILTSNENVPVFQTALPEAILEIYDSVSDSGKEIPSVKQINKAVMWSDVVVLGPGLGTLETAKFIVNATLMCVKEQDKKLILDADGLNLLSMNKDFYYNLPKGAILTPHIGEMARLLNVSTGELKDNLVKYACDYAKKNKIVLALKDARTIITNGVSVFVNLSGNDGMATAGSGDVLSGIVAGIFSVYLKAYETSFDEDKVDIGNLLLAAVSVYIHGKCGDICATNMQKHAIIASDLIEALKFTEF